MNLRNLYGTLMGGAYRSFAANIGGRSWEERKSNLLQIDEIPVSGDYGFLTFTDLVGSIADILITF